MPARFASLAAALALPFGLAACSFAIPSLVPDGSDATGSIAPTPIAGIGFGQEDDRRARSALALALDPQGNGSAVNWDNPASKMRGTITPVGQPFVRDDEICRDFKAITVRTGRQQAREGTACRASAEQWSVQYLGFRQNAS